MSLHDARTATAALTTSVFDGLSGRTAVVTGGTGGMGVAISRALIAAGVQTLVSGVTPDETAKTAEDLGCDGVAADLATDAGIDDVVSAARNTLGDVDIYIAAHGITHSVASVDEELTDFRGVLELNLTATFALSQAFGREMVARGDGRIVLVASLYAFFGGLNVAAYTASKGGVAQLTKALSNEWAPSGVNVNAVAPGYVRTRLNEHVWRDPVRSEEIISRTPAGRWGDPADIAGPVLFLCSPAARFIHGVVLPIDGGFAAR